MRMRGLIRLSPTNNTVNNIIVMRKLLGGADPKIKETTGEGDDRKF